MILKKNTLIFLIIVLTCIFLFSITVTCSAKQELIVAFGQNIITLDPHFSGGTQDQIGTTLIYETLVEYDRDRNIVPKLAIEWKPIDSLTWEFKLRKGVLFHSGNTFNAEAVKFSIERCKESGPGSGYVGFIDNVEVVDEYTVKLHLEHEFGPILNHLCPGVVGMMDPKYVKEKGEDIGQYASGTGPFKLEEYIPGSKTVFVKNEEYWGEPTKLDLVEYRVIPETGTRVMALRSGEVDLIENPPPHELPTIEKDDNLYVYVSPKTRTLFIGFNMQNENVGGEENLALRKAISFAINRKEITDYILEGLGLPAYEGIMPPSVTGSSSDSSLIRKNDIEKAKEILKEAGIKPGKEIEFWVTRGRYLLDSEIAEAIRGQIANIGLNVNMRVMEYASLMSLLGENKHQLYQLAWGCTSGEPTLPYSQLLSTKSMYNFANFGNEKSDELMTKAVATVDRKERMKMYEQVYKEVFDQVAMIPLIYYKNVYAANKKVKGLFASPEEMLDIKNVYIEE